jgi:hypothetical protein
LATTGDKHTKQIIFDIVDDNFKVKIVGDLDLEQVYIVLGSAMMYLEDLASGNTAHPSQELH